MKAIITPKGKTFANPFGAARSTSGRSTDSKKEQRPFSAQPRAPLKRPFIQPVLKPTAVYSRKQAKLRETTPETKVYNEPQVTAVVQEAAQKVVEL